ncbi:MAG TPA: HAMP domain-containing sensor histidine kinase, partial [bacterium]|nr:HAMP domain-containing sensor histidine kinase [bacterium]
IVALQLQVRLLQRDLADFHSRSRTRRILERIDLQSRRVMELTNALLDVTRLTSRGSAPHIERADLAVIVRDAIGRVRTVARASGCRLHVKARTPVYVGCDPLAMEQVVLNLLSNAIKYGEGKPIYVRVGRAGGQALLEVRDTGIGLQRADRSRIFERFVRAVPEGEYGGLGLGLFIVRRIVRMHGGTVRATGSPRRGATFSVTLPLSE